ncbi:MAG: type II toxin-antitoxin system RatA family toxin [Alphaproteobacteria bacterium]|nr:type II toxin-antitoxin system RatA family toxin [Alphaproteobacteria bacterium]
MSTHAEKRVLRYSPEQLYRLVAEVERYPEFLPWCLAARIRKREGDTFWADLVIGFKMIRERFTSKVTLSPDERRIDVAYTEGPFKRLDNHWIFHPMPDGSCEIDFYVDFEFKNRVLQGLMHVLFDEAVRRMVNAFEARAKALYGPPSSPA